jgi:tetratricopeptide (TPR) repeat protein
VLGRNYINRILPVIIVLTAVGVYLNTLNNGYILDETSVILGNFWIKDISNLFEIMTSSVYSFLPAAQEGNFVGLLYRPFIHLSLMLSYHISGYEPWGYHMMNLTYHSVSSLMVYLIALKLQEINLTVKGIKEEAQAFTEHLTALFAALLFATHTINTEPVNWMIANSELSFACFSLIAFYLYISKRYLIAAPFFLISILSKETGFSLILLAVAFDLVIRREQVVPITAWVKRYSIFILTIISYFALRLYSLGSVAPYSSAEKVFTPYLYIINTPRLIIEYMRWLAVPYDLIFFYYQRFDPVTSITEPKAIIHFIFFAVLIYFLVRIRKIFTVELFAVLWIVLPLTPVIYFGWTKGVPIYADRYLYMPSAGFSLLLALVVSKSVYRFMGSPSSKRPAIVAGIILLTIISIYTVGTLKRNVLWKDQYTLLGDSLKKAPENMDLMDFHLKDLLTRNELKSAIKVSKDMILLAPERAALHNNLGVVYARSGMLNEAINEFMTTLAMEPDNADAKKNLDRAMRMKR